LILIIIFVCAETIFESGIGETYWTVVDLDAPVKKRSDHTEIINPKDRYFRFDKTDIDVFITKLGFRCLVFECILD
jgi:hypothetical protein